MGKVKYPNPKFFKAKDRMDWAAQAENLKLVGGIFWDMFKETDWKKFGEGWKNILISDRDRIKEEYKAFAAASMKDKIDLILNGERHLGRLYRDGAMCTVRREWRGIKDTVYDFYEWARLWGMLLMSFSKDLIPAMNQTLYYRWMVSYFCCHSFMDKNILGLRGSNLRMSHELTYCIYRYVAENLVILAKGDRRNGNSEELNSKLVLIDEMTMAQIMAGFPTLYGIPHQLLPVFLVSEIDQLTCIPYIDAVESFGLPADTCPVPTSECGALVIDALPHLQKADCVADTKAAGQLQCVVEDGDDGPHHIQHHQLVHTGHAVGDKVAGDHLAALGAVQDAAAHKTQQNGQGDGQDGRQHQTGDTPDLPDTPEDWLDQFNTFSIYEILPQIIELWGLNVEQQVESKKNIIRQSGK